MEASTLLETDVDAPPRLEDRAAPNRGPEPGRAANPGQEVPW
jgi:hypothetical protein